MKGQAVARSSTEMGYQAMTNKYGVETKAIRNFKARYVYSEEDDATKEFMFHKRVLDCGHGHMGKFFHCSSCRSFKCVACWMNVPDPVINDLLTAWIADVDYSQWVNTCKFCGPENADRHCPATCPGRTKYSIRYGKVVPNLQAYSCHCEACGAMTAAQKAKRPVEAKFCTALRGYVVSETRMRAYQQADLHMCRECFQKDFYGIKPMELRLGSHRYKVVIRASKQHWGDIDTMTADPPYHYLHSLEGGLESSKVEWACLHVGRHHSCHWPGHTCEMRCSAPQLCAVKLSHTLV